MAFINEYISEEDRAEYKIDERFLKRNPQFKEIPEHWEPHWTRDKDRNLFLMETGGTNQAYDDESITYFDFFVDGELFNYSLRFGPGQSINFSEDPYVVSWVLVDVEALAGSEQTIKEVTPLLKEALSAYGCDGKNKWVKNTVVKFSF